MNNGVILQLADGARYQEMITVYFQEMVEYCGRHKFDYWMHGGPVRYWDMDPITPWAKLALVQQAFLQGYQYVICFDADLFICNHAIDLREACPKPINMVRWWKGRPVNHLQGGAIYFNNDKGVAYAGITYALQEAKYFLERNPGKRGWFEQGQLNEMSKEANKKGMFWEIPTKFNWSEDFCPPCKDPVVISYHGVKPVQVVVERMKADMKKYKRVPSDAEWLLLRLMASIKHDQSKEAEMLAAVKYLVDNQMIELGDDGQFSPSGMVQQEIERQVPQEAPFFFKQADNNPPIKP